MTQAGSCPRPDAEFLRHARTDDDGGLALEVIQRSCADIVRDNFPRPDIGFPHTAHDGACRHAVATDKHLALDRRDHADDPVEFFDFRCHPVEIPERLIGQTVDAHMTVQAEDAVEQFGAKAVHDRHHDDQRRHAQRDARQ